MVRLTLLSLLVFITACGELPELAPAASRRDGLGLSNHAAFDAIVGQLSERAQSQARTDAASLGIGGALAVGINSTRLWVADPQNRRVLGFADATTLTNGAAASLVLNQDDFTTIDYWNIPTTQQLVPYVLALDPEHRLYVSDGIQVLVFEDPFSDDLVPDYALSGVPQTVQSIRYLPDTDLLAVMNASSIVIYPRGAREPFAQGSFGAPCPGLASDVAFAGNVYFVSCLGGVLCADNVTPGCAGVYVYGANPTGFVADPGAGYRAYTFFGSPQQMVIDEGSLFVSDLSGNRVIRLSTTAVTWAQAVIGGAGGVAPLALAAGMTFYGQPNETSTVANYHTSGIPQISADGLNGPHFLAVDPDDHRLWVTDDGNARVLAYNQVTVAGPVKTAQVVLGQPDMTHGWPNRLEPNALANLRGVALGGSGATLRAAIVDYQTHRVLVIDSFASYQTGGDPSFVLGQTAAINYLAQNGQPAINATGLYFPADVAFSPNGWLWVCDGGNNRVLTFETPAAGAAANRVYGANTMTEGGVYGGFTRIAATNSHLFVAAGNRVLMYDVNIQQRKPVRVFGQEQPPAGTPAFDDIGTLANRGGGPRADTLSGVTDVAVDADGTLWVADSGNYRVLWFEDPAATTGSLTEHVTADGVVGQPDFTSNAQGMATNRGAFNFFGRLYLSVTDGGALWVADETDSRVLAFFDPKEPDPILGVPVAGLVLGQPDFVSAGADNATNGINSQTLHSPSGLAVSADGRALLVADQGNYRALRAIANQPPVVQGAGTYELQRGQTLSVSLVVTDPDGDAVTVSGVEPVPAGASVQSNAVSYTAPATAPLNTIVRVNVVATDSGPRRNSTTATVAFRVVLQPTDAPGPGTRQPRPPLEEPGCVCTGGAARALVWLLLVPWWAWTRRRRVA